MILNTDSLRVRLNLSGYIAIYGTQDHPYSQNYDLLDANEAERMVAELKVASETIGQFSEMLNNLLDEQRRMLTGRTEIS